MMQAICNSLKDDRSRKRLLDLCSLSLGLAAITIFKLTATKSSLESSILIASCSLYSFTCPLVTVTYQMSHFSRTGLLGEKRAHLCLFLSSQAWAVFSFLALQRLDVGDATALSQVATILTPIVSYYALDSKLDPRQIFLLPVSFVGVILLCRPIEIFFPNRSSTSDCMEGLYGVFLALGASTCRSFMAAAFKATRRTTTLVSTFTASGVSVIIWTCAFMARMRALSYYTCLEGLALFVCGVLASWCILVRRTPWNQNNRLQSALSVLELFLAYSLQVGVFGVAPHWSSATGSALISACSLSSALCGKIGSRNSTSNVGSEFSVVTARKSSTCTQDIGSLESGLAKGGLTPLSPLPKR